MKEKLDYKKFNSNSDIESIKDDQWKEAFQKFRDSMKSGGCTVGEDYYIEVWFEDFQMKIHVECMNENAKDVENLYKFEMALLSIPVIIV